MKPNADYTVYRAEPVSDSQRFMSRTYKRRYDAEKYAFGVNMKFNIVEYKLVPTEEYARLKDIEFRYESCSK